MEQNFFLSVFNDRIKISSDKGTFFCHDYAYILHLMHDDERVPKVIDFKETPTKFQLVTRLNGKLLSTHCGKLNIFAIIYEILFFMEEAKKKYNIDIKFPHMNYVSIERNNFNASGSRNFKWKLNFFKFRDGRKTIGRELQEYFLGYYYPVTMEKYYNRIVKINDFPNLVALLLEIENEIEKSDHSRTFGGIQFRDPAHCKRVAEGNALNIFDVPYVVLGLANPRGMRITRESYYYDKIPNLKLNEVRYYPAFTDSHFCVYGESVKTGLEVL